MEDLLRVENTADELTVQYDIVVPDSELADIDNKLSELELQINEINKSLSKFTNDSDWIDNTIAVASGILCGLIDSLFVGEFSFEEANEWGNEKTNNFVMKIAQSQGYKGDDLAGAIKFLEDRFPIAADKATNHFGGGYYHHLRDFSHHPTPVGMFFSLLTQFTETVYGTDVAGGFSTYKLSGDELFLIGKNIPEKITFGVVNWIFHLVSDMAGSSGSVAMGKLGTGLPGPIASLLKELSALPVFKKANKDGYKEFSIWVSKLFNGTLLGKHDEKGNIVEAVKFDLRTEVGVVSQLGKQAIPVLINECIVRGFYFIRRFANEVKNIRSFRELKDINWEKTVPAKNRTIIRMLTISSGTFMAVDMADAAIRGAVKSGGTLPGFLSQFIVRVNFVGVGRFAVAVGCDVSMGVKKSKLEAQRSSIKTQLMYYKEAKVFYKADEAMAIATEVEEVIDSVTEKIVSIKDYYRNTLSDMDEMSKEIKNSASSFVANNKKTADSISSMLSEV